MGKNDPKPRRHLGIKNAVDRLARDRGINSPDWSNWSNCLVLEDGTTLERNELGQWCDAKGNEWVVTAKRRAE